MPDNTILTSRLAAMIEVPMTEDATPYGASAAYPGYFYHPTLPMVLCETEVEYSALPAGYRATPYTEEEADVWAKIQEAAAEHEEPHTRPRSHR